MLIFQRNIAGLLNYRKVFFPNRDQGLFITEALLRNDVVRMFGLYTELEVEHLVTQRKALTACIDLTRGSEAIWSSMKKKSCRYEINRAEKMLDCVEIESNSERARRDFLCLYNSFAQAKGPVPTLGVRHFNEYGDAKEVSVLYHLKQPLCCHLLLRDKEAGIVKLLYSGSRRLESTAYQSTCGALNRYLHWFEIQKYCEEGFATYDFGGIRYADHPTARFKLSFGAVIRPEYYYLLAGSRLLGNVGNFIYQKCFRSAIIANEIDEDSVLNGAQGVSDGIA